MLNSLKIAFIYFNFRFKEFQGFSLKAGFAHTYAPRTLKQRQKVESGEHSELSSATV